MKKIILGLFVLVTTNLYAQTTVQTQLVVNTNAGINGGSFKVDIQAKATNLTGNNTIGSATIDVNYTAADIAPVIVSGTIVQATYNTTIGTNYTRSANFVAGGPNIRLSISGSNINANGDGTPAGLDLTTSYQTLATINFTILNSAAVTNLTIAPGSLTVGFFNSPNNSNSSGTINPQTMSAPVNIGSQPLPVEMTSFIGVTKGNKVQLTWKTATEVNSSAFQIERRTASDWKKIGELKAAGTSNAPREYSYVDDMENIGSGNILYRLKAVDNNGSYKYSSEVEVTAIPQAYELKANFPNPFNPETKIQYALPGNAKVRLVVYDIIGRQVAELVNEDQKAGYYEKTFTGSNLSSGMYFYRITAQAQGKNVFSQVKKMLLVK